MAQTKEMKSQQSKEAVERNEQSRTMLPAVDIYEDASALTVLADMPGVPKDKLAVEVDNDTLTIEGSADITVSEGMQALYADVRATRYQRSFSLSRELDKEHIAATLKDGLLTVRIPKREEHKRRKIEIQTN